MKLLILLLTGLLLTGSAMGVLLSEADGHTHVLTTWGIEQGLPQESVSALLQDVTGYIWLGTHSGLVRFDGEHFRVFNRWNTPALANDHITALYQEPTGALWVGTAGGGAARFHRGQWSSYNRGRGLSHNTVRAITGDRDTVWIGTDLGLNRIKNHTKNHTIKIFSVGNGLSGYSITALAMDRNGTLLAATGDGLDRLVNGAFHPVLPGKTNPTQITPHITALLPAPDGGLHIGADDGLYYLAPTDPEKKLSNKKLSLPVHTLLLGHRNTLWVGTQGNGLYRLRPGEPTSPVPTLDTRRGLPDDYIYSLLRDRRGNLWVGTYTAGLLRLKSPRLSTFTTAAGLPENHIETVTGGPDGTLWLGTHRRGLVQMKDHRVTRVITTAHGLSDNRIRALYTDGDGTTWIGTAGGGLNRLTEKPTAQNHPNPSSEVSIQIHTTTHGLPADHITVICRDTTGTLWVGTTAGLARLNQGTKETKKENPVKEHPMFLPVPTGDTPTSRSIRALVPGRRNNLWIGTRGGLFSIPSGGGESREFPTTRGHDILSVYEDRDGTLWLGTHGAGLMRLDNVGNTQTDPGTTPDTIIDTTIYTTTHGLPDNHIFSITEDRHENLWISSYRGVFRFSRREPPRGLALFDDKEGMPGAQCAMAGRPAAWQSPAGAIYIPTPRGLTQFRPAGLTDAPPPPRAVIDSVTADNRPVSSVSSVSSHPLPENTGVVEFTFTAPDLASPDKIGLRYRLEGYNDRWTTAPPHQRRALYLNLPAGEYCFHVTARANGGHWADTGARYPFRIGAQTSGKTLVYALLAAVLLLVPVLLIARRRTKKTQPENQPLETSNEASNETSDKTTPETKDETLNETNHGTNRGEKYKTSALLPETVQEVLPNLVRLMETEKIYLDPDLNLKGLAQRLNIHYNYLSRIINEQMGYSFNDYVNRYRVAEAQRRLADPDAASRTILEIAYDTGFYSKSVFNTAFKKFTGTTPSQYRKNETKNERK